MNMNSDKFAGPIKECIEHLRGELEKNPEKWEEVFKIFSDINQRKVKRWISGEYFPNGQSYICLLYSFEELGYDVQELLNLSRDIYLFGRETFAKKMTMGQVLEMLGPDFNQDMIFNYFLRGINTPPIKMQRINEICQKLSTSSKEISPQKEQTERKEEIIADGDENIAMKKSTVADYFCHLVEMALPLAEALMSDDFSPADRRKIREDLGRNKFFRLSVLFDGLSSEESRVQVLKSLHSQLKQNGGKI